jgi:hypothetical protein
MSEAESDLSGGPSRDSGADLARSAGIEGLATGVAVDHPEGERLRAVLLGDEMAASHRLMMRIAARSNLAVQRGLAAGDGDALPFDLAAARLAGMAGRLGDHYRRGLLTLRKLVVPAEPEGVWHGLSWEGVPEISEEEVQRRIARVKAARAANDNSDGPPLSDAEEAALDAADEAADRLVAGARVEELTRGHTAERLFADQLAASHHLMMWLSARADSALDRLADPDAAPQTEPMVLHLATAATRLMERYRLGLLALDRLGRNPGGGPPKMAGIFWAGPLREGEREAEIAGDAAKAAAAAAGANAALPLQAGRRPVLPLERRGRLRHGNPAGDFLAAPRCGACTRAGHPCRQPAMANGRCRLHGGKSTGPRTVAGLARSRTARLAHGLRSAEVIELRAAAVAASRRLRALVAGTPLAGHGVHRPVFRSPLASPASPTRRATPFDGPAPGSESEKLRQRA